MVRTFAEAFVDVLAASGLSLAWVARDSGVSEDHLNALLQHPDTHTNVDDAKKIAGSFGVGLDVFLGDPDLKGPLEIVELYNQLPPHLKRQFQAFGQGLLGEPDLSGPE